MKQNFLRNFGRRPPREYINSSVKKKNFHLLGSGMKQVIYCKFGNFRENIIFANSVKEIFATLKIRHEGMIYL